MEVKPLPWDAQAISRFEAEGPFLWLWEPQELAAVLGAGTPAGDVNLPLCAMTGVPVYRRRGGGGAVLLGPGVVVITAAYRPEGRTFATQWVEPVARGIADALADLGVSEAHVKGLGDVALGERKILGSSLYARRDLVLYQGSLLVESDLSLIPQYLPHPSREPDYRRGREHLNFVTSLAESGHRLERGALYAALAERLAPGKV
ncbi:MAG: biotin/lipoate A/B protein ligase family protein [Mycobacterium leprae]